MSSSGVFQKAHKFGQKQGSDQIGKLECRCLRCFRPTFLLPYQVYAVDASAGLGILIDGDFDCLFTRDMTILVAFQALDGNQLLMSFRMYGGQLEHVENVQCTGDIPCIVAIGTEPWQQLQ